MANITKEQWKKLEEEMTYGFVSIRFKYQGYELSIQRVRTAENKTALAVYIDDVINQAWGVFDSKLLKEPESRPSIIKEVWKQCSMAVYKPSQVKRIEKVWGKRRAKKEFPDLHERRYWFGPTFSKASVLCRQFRKLEGLELIEGGL